MLPRVLAAILILLVALGVVSQVRKAMQPAAATVAADTMTDLTLAGRTAASQRGKSLSSPLPPLDSITRLTLRDQIRSETDRHYLDSLLSGTDSMVRHWPPELEPVPFAVIPGGPASFTSDMAFEARDAIDAWRSAGTGVRLIETNDTLAALIKVRWVDTLGGERGGYTDVAWDRSGRIRRALVTLATRATATGNGLSPQSRREIALHEVGHALGLPHSNRPTDVMFPVAQNEAPTDRDRFSLRMLYQLPTGWIGVAPRSAQ